MTEEQIKGLYNSFVEYPNKVLEIFNDFFGEEYVDMQDFSYERFKDFITKRAISSFLQEDTIKNSSEYQGLEEVDRVVIDSLLEEGILSQTLNSELAYKLLPFIKPAYVEFRGCIMVHFPKVRVTNEYDRYIDITHLYAEVQIRPNGTSIGYFLLNRSEFTKSQYNANYLHSHINGISLTHPHEFKAPCLGSGPIRNTLSSLSIGFDESLWQLFCLELSKYVTVESISGVPYYRLEDVHKANHVLGTPHTTYGMHTAPYLSKHPLLLPFIEYLVSEDKLKYNYINGSYSIAMGFKECAIFLSNEFIKWYNDCFNRGTYGYTYTDLLESRVIVKYIITGPKISEIYPNPNSHYLNENEGKYVCTFKGKDVLLHITEDDDEEERNYVLLLNLLFVETIVNIILESLNYVYSRPKAERDAGVRTPKFHF